MSRHKQYKNAVKYLESPEDHKIYRWDVASEKWYGSNISWLLGYPSFKYTVIHKDYQDLWDAYLNKELEVLNAFSKWEDWASYNSEFNYPTFCLSIRNYRRKSTTITVTANGKTVEISQESAKALGVID